jgi:acetylornithine deacetylase
VRAELEEVAAAGGADVELGLVREPFEVDPGEAVVRAVVEHAGDAELYGDHPWMDAALTSAAGIPTVVFGPGGEGAHAVDEFVELDSVARCAEVLLATAAELCA